MDTQEMYESAKQGTKDALREFFGDIMFSKAQAAKYLKISRPTLDKYIIEGYVKQDETTGQIPLKDLAGVNISEIKNKRFSGFINF